MFDLILCGGTVVDGTGNPSFVADIAIASDRIAALGHLADAEARETLDAAGLIVCPGFVDCHSHSDTSILANRPALSSLYQGVTTEIVGNCGMSPAPLTALSAPAGATFRSMGDYLDRIAEGVGINVGVQVGHAALRGGAMRAPETPLPTSGEMVAMETLLDEALDEGAIGLSFGLEFMPGRVCEPEELRRLCTVAARHGRTTSWHVRNRDRRFEAAVDEAIAVTRDAGARLQLSHLSAKLGSAPRAWNWTMEAVRRARAQGQDVQCDMIPYTVGPGSLAAILPDWATEGGHDEVRARLRDPETRQRLMAESDRYWLLFYHRQWDKLTLARSEAHPEWVGLTFREIGERAGQDPFDCVYDLLADEPADSRPGVNGVLFSEGDIVEWLSDPLFAIASDGKTLPVEGPLTAQANHPSCYGWTPRVIETYVREERVFTLEEAVRKMTSMPAARFCANRGLLRPGMIADVAVFHPERFRTRATYLAPRVYAEGMVHVLVNGAVALRDGQPTGALAGRILGR